jgi:predicted DsbA family dithiol-disulfide isomerase
LPTDKPKKSGEVPTVDKFVLAKVKLSDMNEQQKDALERRMNQIGRSVGIKFKSGGKIGSTRAAHHLIHLSQMAGRGSATPDLVGRLFEAYHELELDISARDVLRQIAVEVGLDAADVDAYLDLCFDSSPSTSTSSFASSILLADEIGHLESIIDKQARENRQRTNTGVPLFIIQGEYRVDGAQDLMEFVEVFGKIRESTDTIQ